LTAEIVSEYRLAASALRHLDSHFLHYLADKEAGHFLFSLILHAAIDDYCISFSYATPYSHYADGHASQPASFRLRLAHFRLIDIALLAFAEGLADAADAILPRQRQMTLSWPLAG
jgi:hypothetical protein